MSTREPELIDVIQRAISRALADLRVSTVARVERYDAATQLVDVLPLLKDTHENEEGEAVVTSFKVISNVPIVFPGGGGFSVTWPIAKGDTVLLVFADRSLDRWIEQGGEVDPKIAHRHNLSDAIAIAGVRPKPQRLENVPDDRVRVQGPSGATVDVTADEVILNGGTEGVARVGDPCNNFSLIAGPYSVSGTIAISGGSGSVKAGD